MERCELTGTPPVRAEAVVVKDAGDDPDVTHGAELTATVDWSDVPGLRLAGGAGVGIVTKPGLGLAVGGPAINDTPRRMIGEAVAEVVDLSEVGVRVVISVPRRRDDGPQDHQPPARHPRRHLDPRHHRHRPAVLHRVVAGQRGAGGARDGRPGRADGGALHRRAYRDGPPARCCRELPEVCFVEVGDFTGAARDRRRGRRHDRVVFVGMAGKLAKLAAGMLMTHYTRSKVDLSLLGAVTAEAGGDPSLVAAVTEANTGAARVRAVGGRRAARPGR